MNTEITIMQYNDPAYSELVNHITDLWTEAKADAITAVNAHLLDANWKTGQYIVEFEQKGMARAEYGKQLLVNLSKDLTIRCGRGFSRSNLTYMRKLYLAFPKSETLSHKLTWSIPARTVCMAYDAPDDFVRVRRIERERKSCRSRLCRCRQTGNVQ